MYIQYIRIPEMWPPHHSVKQTLGLAQCHCLPIYKLTLLANTLVTNL